MIRKTRPREQEGNQGEKRTQAGAQHADEPAEQTRRAASLRNEERQARCAEQARQAGQQDSAVDRPALTPGVGSAKPKASRARADEGDDEDKPWTHAPRKRRRLRKKTRTREQEANPKESKKAKVAAAPLENDPHFAIAAATNLTNEAEDIEEDFERAIQLEQAWLEDIEEQGESFGEAPRSFSALGNANVYGQCQCVSPAPLGEIDDEC